LDENLVRIVSGVLAVACVLIIILRRRTKQQNSQKDDF